MEIIKHQTSKISSLVDIENSPRGTKLIIGKKSSKEKTDHVNLTMDTTSTYNITLGKYVVKKKLTIENLTM